MKAPGFVAALICLALAVHAQSNGFRPLPAQNATDMVFEQYQLHLADPDKPDKPAMWQGPLTISAAGVSCTADISLITAVYAAPGHSFVIVLSTSGSNATAHFVDAASCADKWPPIKHAAASAQVEGSRLSFSATCEGGAPNSPFLCTAARVFAIRDASPPLFLKVSSYKLTEKELGVGFSGEARVIDPRTPRALIVH